LDYGRAPDAEQKRTLSRDVIAQSVAGGNVGTVSAETIKAVGRALAAAGHTAATHKT
jgi:hypothetical protein